MNFTLRTCTIYYTFKQLFKLTIIFRFQLFGGRCFGCVNGLRNDKISKHHKVGSYCSPLLVAEISLLISETYCVRIPLILFFMSSGVDCGRYLLTSIAILRRASENVNISHNWKNRRKLFPIKNIFLIIINREHFRNV